MNDEALQLRHVLVEGCVQGVGYREFVRRSAARFHISGWVRNRTGGRVEALACGASDDLEALLAEMRKGPRGSEVTNLRIIEQHDATAADKTGAFAVRPTL
jgi:acylphosphatase